MLSAAVTHEKDVKALSLHHIQGSFYVGADIQTGGDFASALEPSTEDGRTSFLVGHCGGGGHAGSRVGHESHDSKILQAGRAVLKGMRKKARVTQVSEKRGRKNTHRPQCSANRNRTYHMTYDRLI